MTTVSPPRPAALASPVSLRASVSKQRLGFILAGVILGMLLAALDSTVVGTAMPRIVAELNGLQYYAWVFTAYMLASTITVPLYGKLSDIYGRRPFFLAGMGIFMLGTALCGLSQNMTELVLFRGFQGLGAGAIMPLSQAIIGDIFPPAERAKWQGALMSVFGIATIGGPLLGGWITDNLGWRYVFYVTVPVGIAAMVTTGAAMPGIARRVDQKIDYIGAMLLIAGTLPLLLAFSWAGVEYAWTSPMILSLLGAAVVLLAAFMYAETKAPAPIISPSLLRDRTFTVSISATMLVTLGMFGASMFLPLFVQGVIGTNATNSGLIMSPMMIGFIISSTVGGLIISQTGRYKALALVDFVIAGTGMFLLSRLDVNATEFDVVRDMAIVGLGIGGMMSLFTIVVQSAFPLRMLGEVTSSLQFFRSLGGTIGTAVLGSLLTNKLQSSLAAGLPQEVTRVLSPEQLGALQNPQVLMAAGTQHHLQQAFAAAGPAGQALYEQVILVIRTSLANSIATLYLAGCLAMVGGFLITLMLPELPLRTRNDDVAVPLAE